MAGRRPQTEPEGHVRIGQIVGPFGIKGGLKVQPLTDFPERFVIGATVFLDGEARKVTGSHWHKTQVRISLEGLTSVTDAELLKWRYLTVPEEDRPELDNGEYLARDLIGMTLVEAGTPIGTIDEVVHSPAHDILRSGDCLIPFVESFIKNIDLESRVVTVKLIEGMRPGEQVEVDR